MPNLLIELLKLLCCLDGNNAFVSRDQEYWDANVAHQFAIVWIGGCKNLEGSYSSGQPRIGHVLEKFGRPMRMPKPEISQQRALGCFQELAVLFQHSALVHFALPLRAYESRVGKNDRANGGTELACCDSRGHASHRMSQNDRFR
jgi:hypothetical protein